MAEVKVLHMYKSPPKEEKLIIRDGARLSEVLYKLGIRYDTAIVALNNTIVHDLDKIRVSDKVEVTILDILDGG